MFKDLTDGLAVTAALAAMLLIAASPLILGVAGAMVEFSYPGLGTALAGGLGVYVYTLAIGFSLR